MSDIPTPESDAAELEANIGVTAFDSSDLVEAYDFARTLERRLTAMTQERDEAKRLAAAWEDTAAQHLRNEFFYHDIIVKMGEPFGIAAKTSDDGSIQQDVLTLKVPELVDALRADRDKARSDFDRKLNFAREELKALRADIAQSNRKRDLAERKLAVCSEALLRISAMDPDGPCVITAQIAVNEVNALTALDQIGKEANE